MGLERQVDHVEAAAFEDRVALLADIAERTQEIVPVHDLADALRRRRGKIVEIGGRRCGYSGHGDALGLGCRTTMDMGPAVRRSIYPKV
jgi:hypothetical protein